MLSHVKRRASALLNRYVDRLSRQEFESQSFLRFTERPVEYAYVFNAIRSVAPRTVLDVGTGTTALPHLMRHCGCLVTATDNVRDYWPAGMVNRHWHVIDDDINATRLSAGFDLVTCVSVLEHIQTPDAAVRNMLSLLAPGGHLLMTFPYTEGSYVKNVYDLPGSSYGRGAPYVTQSYSRRELDRWLAAEDATIVDQEYWRFWEGDHWTVGAQVIPPRGVTVDETHQLTCVLIRNRDAGAPPSV